MELIGIGKRIKHYRTLNKLTSEALSEKVGISHIHMRAIESERSAPSLEVFIKLSEQLNISPQMLLSDHAEYIDSESNAAFRMLQQLDLTELRLTADIIETYMQRML